MQIASYILAQCLQHCITVAQEQQRSGDAVLFGSLQCCRLCRFYGAAHLEFSRRGFYVVLLWLQFEADSMQQRLHDELS